MEVAAHFSRHLLGRDKALKTPAWEAIQILSRHFKLGLSFHFLVSGYRMKQLAAVLCSIYYMVKKFVQYWGKTWPI